MTGPTLEMAKVILVTLGCLCGLSGGSGGPRKGGLADIYDSPVLIGNKDRTVHNTPMPDKLQNTVYPEFITEFSGNVTAAKGKTALLNCRVKNVGEQAVSWIRDKDTLLLAIGRYTYTSDYRFKAIHKVMSEDYLLQIRPVQMEDAGLYQCQVSTTPIMAHNIYLTVAEPYTEIVGGPEIFLNEGSMMNITCLVKDSPEPPNYIFWFHNKKSITYNSPRGGITQITERGDITVSYLLVQSARLSDSGEYMCQPSVGQPAYANLHVMRGKDPEKWLTSSSYAINPFASLILASATWVLYQI